MGPNSPNPCSPSTNRPIVQARKLRLLRSCPFPSHIAQPLAGFEDCPLPPRPLLLPPLGHVGRNGRRLLATTGPAPRAAGRGAAVCAVTGLCLSVAPESVPQPHASSAPGPSKPPAGTLCPLAQDLGQGLGTFSTVAPAEGALWAPPGQGQGVGTSSTEQTPGQVPSGSKCTQCQEAELSSEPGVQLCSCPTCTSSGV